MSILAKVGNFLSGGLGNTIIETVKDYFPPSLSQQEKAQIEHAINETARAHEVELLKIAAASDAEFHSLIKDLEGTSSDLAGIGWLGKIIIFLRGAFRPLFAYFVAILDFMVFSGKWSIAESVMGVDMNSIFWTINLLVLGFFFGERAIKNIMPVLKDFKK